MKELARRHAGWLLALGATAVLLPGIGDGLWDPWETHYAEVARRVVVDNDWVTLRWGNPDSAPSDVGRQHLFFSKPVLAFWLMAASFLIFGVSEAAARLPMVLLAAGGVAGAFYYLRRLVPFRAALLSALVMLTAPLYAMLGHQAVTDMPFVAPMTVGTLAFAAVLLDRGTDPGHAYVGYFCLAAATLAKGLLGFLIPGAALFVLLLVTADFTFLRDPWSALRHGLASAAVFVVALAIGLWVAGSRGFGWAAGIAGVGCAIGIVLAASGEKLRRLRMPTGVPVFLGICATWYLPVILEHGMVFVREFFLVHHFGRATTGVGLDLSGLDLHDGTAGYYLQQLGYAFFPWVAALPAAILAWAGGGAAGGGGETGVATDAAPARSRRGPEPALALLALLLAWVGVSYVVFTASTVKFHHYVLPLIPPLAIIVGVGLDRMVERGVGRFEAAALLLGGAIAVLVWRELTDDPNRLLRLFTYKYTRELPQIAWMRIPLAAGLGLALGAVAAAVAGRVAGLRMGAARAARAGRLGAIGLSGALFAAAATVTGPVVHGAMRQMSRWISQKDAFDALAAEGRDDGERLVSWADNWRGEVFYSQDRVTVIEPRDRQAEAKLRRILRAPGRVFFVTTDPDGLRDAIGRIAGRAVARDHCRVLTTEKRTFATILYDGPSAGTYDPRVAALPPDALVPPGAPAGAGVLVLEPDGPGKLTLAAARLGAPSVAPGGSLRVDLFLRCEATPYRDWDVFIHADAPAPSRKPRVANGDHVFAGGALRTGACRQGELLLDTWDLEFPGGAAPGRYELFAGFWHPQTGDRMVVDPSTAAGSPSAAGEGAIGEEYVNRVFVGTVSVE